MINVHLQFHTLAQAAGALEALSKLTELKLPLPEVSVDAAEEKPAKKSKPATSAAPQEDAPAQTPTAPASHSEFTLEEVRAKMAELTQAGKRAEVKKLLADFGAGSVSGLDPAKYAEAMAKAEALAKAKEENAA